MKPNLERIKEIFLLAMQKKSPEERELYLAETCQGDLELRRHVESLLHAQEEAGTTFLGGTVKLTAPSYETERAGMMIGRYKLLELIGEGGFGTVWMAEQEEPVRRRVALKVIKPGMDTKQVLARFEAERQALAMMDHPSIARVFDGGATDTGRPYFVMELVRGVRITEYCDANKLSMRERLALFIQVCQAVQHAHQKGIIHRDLKPSNILVTEVDGAPVPKVIDFGVAKATQARLTERTLFTGLHQMIGTPSYMSPEQAGLGALDMDTRSDIYALGVLLYELLTGQTPLTKEEFEKAGLDEIFRLIREQEPPKPSTRLSSLTREQLTAIAAKRQAEPFKLNRLLRGDLDWIVMKALEKDRRRRYETASGLASDLLRHLNNEPVVARPPSNVYRFQKMVRRNKLVFAAGTAVAAAVLAGLVMSTYLFIQEKRAHDRALAAEHEQSRLRKEAEAERARAEAALQESKAAEATARNAQKLAQKVAMDALEGAKLYHTDKPDLTNAEAFFRSVLDMQDELLSDNQVEYVATACDLAGILDDEHKPDEAEATLREALELRTKIAGEEQPDAASILGKLGDMLQRHGKKAEGETVFRQAFSQFLQKRATRSSIATNSLKLEQNDLAAFLQLTNLADLQYAQEFEQKLEEAARFMVNLKVEGQVPVWQKNEKGNFTIGWQWGKAAPFDPEIYPISMTGWAKKKEKDVSTYNFTVVQASKGSAWKLQRAWRTGSDGKTIAEYSVQSVPDSDEALKLLKKAADQGNADSQQELGELYANGAGVAKDAVESAKWYRKAAEQGNDDAQKKLGEMYANGTGVAKDPIEAAKWYRKAAEQGDADAQNKLGWMYASVTGVAMDPIEAVKWYRKSAEQGNADAQEHLGECYEKGLGVAKELTEAVKWYRKAAEQGNADAEGGLFLMYAKGEGVAQEEAVKWLRKEAEQGNPYSQAYLGDYYAGGLGVAKDLTEAVKWYRQSAEQGNAIGQIKMCACYEQGMGVAKDLTEAVKWCRKAAEQGNADAQKELGECYENGDGVAKDLTEAANWYRKAAGQGNADAKASLARLENKPATVKLKDKAETIKIQEQTLALNRKTLGPEHPDTLKAMSQLALSYSHSGRLNEAIKLQEEMLALRRKVSGPEHPDTLEAMGNLADSYFSVGREKEAITLLEKACEVTPTDTDVLIMLAVWQSWFGRYADYDPPRRLLVQQAEGTNVATTAERAAKVYCLRPSTDAALLTNVLNLAQQAVALGKNSPHLPWDQLALGLAQYRNNQFAAADRTLAVAEQSATGEYQQDIQDTARMFRVMSLSRQDRPEEARKLFSQAEAQMPPLPADERKPFVDGKPIDHEVLFCWLAYKEAKSLLNKPH